MSTCMSNRSHSLSLTNKSQSVSTLSATSTDRPDTISAKKVPYQDVVQAHYLDLEAEIELLLQHLQSLSKQKLTITSQEKND